MPATKPPSLKELTRKSLDTFEALYDFGQEMNTGTDRACALVGAAAIDSLLKELIVGQFRDTTDAMIEKIFFKPNAVLGTFSSKVDLCHALGLLNDDEVRQIASIRRIRNAFAHAVTALNFDSKAIATECAKLKQGASEQLGTTVSIRQRFLDAVMAAMQVVYDRQIEQHRLQRAKLRIPEA
jgi:mannitol operon repressor